MSKKSNGHHPMWYVLPSVQLIGAQKAGTSAIADWIFEGGFRRPIVMDDEPWYYSKEVHFFDLYERYKQGVEFYAKRFQNEAKSMDASPDTLPYPERVRQIYDVAGGNQVDTLKIIVVLREPISRELLLYNHLVHDYYRVDANEKNEWHHQVTKADGSVRSFDEFVREVSLPALNRESGPGNSTRHGLYANHLNKWFEIFDRRQILVLSYEELRNDPRRLQERIQQFLGLRIPGDLRRANSNDHPEKVTAPSDTAFDTLNAIFTPHNAKLYSLLEANPGPPMEERPFRKFQSLRRVAK